MNTNMPATVEEVTMVIEALAVEIEHLGAEAFTVQMLTDIEVTEITIEETGCALFPTLSPAEAQVVLEDPDLREMYQAIRGLELAAPLPDLEDLQALVDADAATRAA